MPNSDTDQIELRGMCPRQTVDVLDAIALSRKCSRVEVINEILAEWATARVHEATLVLRVTRTNGSNKDGCGK